MLQIVTLLSLQDGSVLDAVRLWKKNVDKASTKSIRATYCCLRLDGREHCFMPCNVAKLRGPPCIQMYNLDDTLITFQQGSKLHVNEMHHNRYNQDG